MKLCKLVHHYLFIYLLGDNEVFSKLNLTLPEFIRFIAAEDCPYFLSNLVSTLADLYYYRRHDILLSTINKYNAVDHVLLAPFPSTNVDSAAM